MGQVAPLLCHGSSQGNGGDGDAGDAFRDRNRRKQVAY